MSKYWCYSIESTAKDDETPIWFVEFSNSPWDLLPRLSYYGDGSFYAGFLCLHFGRM